jgi:hypothetical protein
MVAAVFVLVVTGVVIAVTTPRRKPYLAQQTH